MKSFPLFAVVCFVAVFAANAEKLSSKDELKAKFEACLAESGWSKQKFSDLCSLDPPTEEPDSSTFKALNTCIWKAAGVIEVTDSGVVIHPQNVSNAVPEEKAETVVSIIQGCAKEAESSDATASAMLIYECYRNKNKAEYIANCKNFVSESY